MLNPNSLLYELILDIKSILIITIKVIRKILKSISKTISKIEFE